MVFVTAGHPWVRAVRRACRKLSAAALYSSPMKIPSTLQPLIDDGVIDEVIRPLRSGKEASIYVVRAGGRLCCAKVYKDLRQRSFQQRSQYQEGRHVRSSRQARAMSKSSSFGRKSQETAWKSAEVDALGHLARAGVRVPETYGFFNGVLLMELIVADDGEIAPDLGEVEHSPQQARDFHQFLIRQIVGMLCAGLVHGDLSEYNVLVGTSGPVIIDLPQVVSASGNNSARAMLLRDVNNITATLARFAPELLATRFGEEMWDRFERGTLEPDSVLSGEFAEDDSAADVDGTLEAINDARQQAEFRQAGREAAASPDERAARIQPDYEPDPGDGK